MLYCYLGLIISLESVLDGLRDVLLKRIVLHLDCVFNRLLLLFSTESGRAGIECDEIRLLRDCASDRDGLALLQSFLGFVKHFAK